MVYLSGFQFRDNNLNTSEMNLPYFKVLGLALPIVGCLSDVFAGRYRIVRYSNWVRFFSLVAFNLVLVLLTYTWYSRVFTTLLYMFKGLVIIITARAMANAVQLRIDQLVHASSSDIQSYLSWYVWNFSLANTVVSLTKGCCCKMFNKVRSWALFYDSASKWHDYYQVHKVNISPIKNDRDETYNSCYSLKVTKHRRLLLTLTSRSKLYADAEVIILDGIAINFWSHLWLIVHFQKFLSCFGIGGEHFVTVFWHSFLQIFKQ